MFMACSYADVTYMLEQLYGFIWNNGISLDDILYYVYIFQLQNTRFQTQNELNIVSKVTISFIANCGSGKCPAPLLCKPIVFVKRILVPTTLNLQC